MQEKQGEHYDVMVAAILSNPQDYYHKFLSF